MTINVGVNANVIAIYFLIAKQSQKNWAPLLAYKNGHLSLKG